MCNDAAQVMFASVFVEGLIEHSSLARIVSGLLSTMILWYAAYKITNTKRGFYESRSYN